MNLKNFVSCSLLSLIGMLPSAYAAHHATQIQCQIDGVENGQVMLNMESIPTVPNGNLIYSELEIIVQNSTGNWAGRGSYIRILDRNSKDEETLATVSEVPDFLTRAGKSQSTVGATSEINIINVMIDNKSTFQSIELIGMAVHGVPPSEANDTSSPVPSWFYLAEEQRDGSLQSLGTLENCRWQ